MLFIHVVFHEFLVVLLVVLLQPLTPKTPYFTMFNKTCRQLQAKLRFVSSQRF